MTRFHLCSALLPLLIAAALSSSSIACGGDGGTPDAGSDEGVADLGSSDAGVADQGYDAGPPATCDSRLHRIKPVCPRRDCDQTCDAVDPDSCTLTCDSGDPTSCTWSCARPACSCAAASGPETCTYPGPTCNAVCEPPRCSTACAEGACVEDGCPSCEASCGEAACATTCDGVSVCADVFQCRRIDATCTTTCNPVSCIWVDLDAAGDAGVGAPDAGLCDQPLGGSTRVVEGATGSLCSADAGVGNWGVVCERPQCEIRCFDGPYIECETAECQLDCENPTCTVTCDTPTCVDSDGGVDCGAPANCVVDCACTPGVCTETRT